MFHRAPLALTLVVSALLGCAAPGSSSEAALSAAVLVEMEGLPEPSAHLNGFVPSDAWPAVHSRTTQEELQRLLEPLTVSDPGSSLPVGADPGPVQELDIVGHSGDRLVVLRRGRLFTFDVSNGGLRQVARVAGHAPEVTGENTLYERVLVNGDRVVVVGYSFARKATELGVFRMLPGGPLVYERTVSIEGEDPGKWRPFPVWRVGDTLMLYTARRVIGLDHSEHSRSPLGARESEERVFAPLDRAERIYRADGTRGDPGQWPLMVHTLTRCSLTGPALPCASTEVLAPEGGQASLSPGALYVWASRSQRDRMVLRFPLTGGAPQALRVQGSILSDFLERNGHLHAVVDVAQNPMEGVTSWGPTMEIPERPPPEYWLLRVPLEAFGGLGNVAPASAYLELPDGDYGNFLSHWLPYWNRDRDTRSLIDVDRLDSGRVNTDEFAFDDLPTGTLLPMGRGALSVDSRNNWPEGHEMLFTALGLDAAGPVYRLEDFVNAEEERNRLGYGYRDDGGERGVAGVPVLVSSVSNMWGNSSGILFLQRDGLNLHPLGQLESSHPGKYDFCVSSCRDQPGNARPLFVGDRIFALLGYEVVEGRLHSGPDGAIIEEVARVEFTPRRP